MYITRSEFHLNAPAIIIMQSESKKARTHHEADCSLPVNGTDIHMPQHSLSVHLMTDTWQWQHLLCIIPEMPNVCVAGSAATWMAQQHLTGKAPKWTPSDVDVFVFGSRMDYLAVVEAVTDAAVSHNTLKLVTVEIGATSDLYFMANNAALPKLSFVHTVCQGVIRTFDINVCQVILMLQAGSWRCFLTSETADHIKNSIMTCRFIDSIWGMSYKNEKTALRVLKYQSRGFALCTLFQMIGTVAVTIDGTMHLAIDQDITADAEARGSSVANGIEDEPHSSSTIRSI